MQPRQKPKMSKPRTLSRALTLLFLILLLTHLPSFAQSPPPRQLPGQRQPSYNLEMRWGKHNFHDRICRVHNACMINNTLLIHPWMKPYLHHLHACGITRLAYLNPSTNLHFRNLDLFGVTPARYHIPHFLTDVLPMVYASTLLRERFAADVHAVCETPRRARCRPIPVNPGLLVEKRAYELPKQSWVKQLSTLLPGQPRLVPPEEGCFKSVIAYKRSYLRRGRRWYSKGELFEKAGITRTSVMGSCSPHVIVLNRVGWLRRGGVLLGRDIVNVDAVVREVKTRAPLHGLNVSVEVAYFENRTFFEQVGIMQRADVLLGAHGAGLGNLLFARLDVPLLEVLPFGYYAGPFDRLASSLYLNYSRIVAEPDDDTFMDCLKTRAGKYGQESEFDEDLETWKTALRDWKETKDESVLQTHLLTAQRNSTMKICARAQRLTIDPGETADRLLDMASGICRGNAMEI